MRTAPISGLWKLTKGKQQTGKWVFFFFFLHKELLYLIRIVEFFDIFAWDCSQPAFCPLSEKVLAGSDVLKKPAASVLVLVSTDMFNSVRTPCSPPSPSVHGTLLARILEWVAMPPSRGTSWPRDGIRIPCIGRWILYHWVTWRDCNWVSAENPPLVVLKEWSPWQVNKESQHFVDLKLQSRLGKAILWVTIQALNREILEMRHYRAAWTITPHPPVVFWACAGQGGGGTRGDTSYLPIPS